MASPIQWTRVWVNSGNWWWTGRAGVLQSMVLQRVGHGWATKLNWTRCFSREGWSIRNHHIPFWLLVLYRWFLLAIYSNTLVTWCKELTHLKRPWCWERLKAGGEGDDRGWEGWMASPTQWTWVWVDSGSWWWNGRPDALRFIGSQRVRHDWATEVNWTDTVIALRMLNVTSWQWSHVI